MSNYSKKREMIYDYLKKTTAHPKAEEIYAGLKAQIPSLSLATVYRNLKLFEVEGRIISISRHDGSQSFDADMSVHYHFECDDCGRIYDIPMQALDGINKFAESVGRAERHSLVFYGKCNHCKKLKN